MRQSLLTAFFVLLSAISYGQVVMNVDATQRGPLTSPYQYGLFFEEINHAGDGGLYAELVRNRAFVQGTDDWTAVGGATIGLDFNSPLNDYRAVSLTVSLTGASAARPRGVSNSGYWGMAFHADSTYTLNVWLKGTAALTGNLQARLIANDGSTVVGSADITGDVNPDTYTKHTVAIKATGDASKGSLQIVSTTGGSLTLAYVSLFPYTWKGRANGLRPDLAQLLYDTHPRFLRFPGGCYVEGQYGLDNSFRWKNTIGPVEARPGHHSYNWGYWSTDGLGFDEYLQLCEDLGAAPLFVVNVGLGHGYYVPMEDVDTLVQNTLDAIEYANGDASTYWGAKRIANGHAAPYNLKFIEIGNENYNFSTTSNSDQSYQYPERYYKFYKAIKEKYPEITTIGNVEAWGTDDPSWRNDYPVEMVDEHYYRTFSWMLNNYTKYDAYNRNIKVYNGEYAANSGSYGTYGNLNSALGEAVYMLGMERNSDVAVMGSFAPIFRNDNDGAWQWAYDMIHFDADGHFVTPSYYVQKLFGHNLGTQNLKWTESGNVLAGSSDSVKVGVATWNTQAQYDDVTVTDTAGNVLASDDFSGNASNWTLGAGNWSVGGGVLSQTASGTNNDLGMRAVMDKGVNGEYIYKVRARKTGGAEGFLIMFNVQDDNNYYWWNLGGWGNTQHAVEHAVNGGKTTVASASGSIETGRWYDIEIRVSQTQVTCLLDGEQVHQFSLPTSRAVYQSVQLDSVSNELIVKLVNPNDQAATVALNAKNMTLGSTGTVERLTSEDGEDENSMSEPDNVVPANPVSVNSIDATGKTATLDAPAYSLSIFRFPVSNVGEEPAKVYPQAYIDEDSDKAGYLYAHMNRSQEITNYALSRTGQSWTDLLGSDEVFDTKAATTTGGMRDAYVCRLQEGGFMLVGTDMTSRLDWTSNHIMDLMISPDLVHWTKEVKIDLESEDNLKALGGISADEMTAAWAPQVIYDPATKDYVLYYSVGFKSGYHKTYYQLIDKDLNILTEPRLYFDPGYDIIDDDIVYNAVTGLYQMVYKCESATGFNRATATHLVPQAGEETGTTVWTITDGFHVNENNQAIEAPTQWRPIGSDRWNLSYINYSRSGYGYKTRYMDGDGLNPSGPYTMSGDVQAQHGSIIKLTEAEYQYLEDWDQVNTLLPTARTHYTESQLVSIGEAITLGENALNTTTTFEENAKAMSEARKALEAADAAYSQYLIDKLRNGGETDLTSYIVNPDFSQYSTGWTLSNSFTQANGYVAEYWNNYSFDMHQTITGMPAGEYEVTVQSFYRYGYISPAVEAHDGYNGATEELFAYLYANDDYVPIKSLYDDDEAEKGGFSISPYNFPDNVAQANTAFNTKGLYKNTLRFSLAEDGDITLGICKYNGVDGDWCCFDNFTLRYLGNNTGIKGVNTDEGIVKNQNVYNLNGQRVSNTTAPGIYVRGGKKEIKR